VTIRNGAGTPNPLWKRFRRAMSDTVCDTGVGRLPAGGGAAANQATPRVLPTRVSFCM